MHHHNFRLVNNRYDEQGQPVIEGGEWKTEKKCKDCGEVLEVPEYLKKEFINRGEVI